MKTKTKSNSKKYEYAANYYRNGHMVGRSAERWATLEEARLADLYRQNGEKIVFVRREIGEWEEIKE